MADTHEDHDRVVVVTGAARGIGRGIALELGATGATVYVTDRDSRAKTHSPLPGTVEDTAEQLTERGGRGIAVTVDQRDDAAIEALFERIGEEQGGLDLLVANAGAGNDLPFRPGPFWELALEHWHNMFDCGVRGHLVTARFAAPLLMQRRGLVVLTGYKDPASAVLGNHVYYDLAMHATSRLAHCLAHDLRPQGVGVVCVAPGFTRTEAIVAALGDHPRGSDSVAYPARAVRALYEDPVVQRHTGRTLSVAELAAEYGFEDPG